MKTLSTLSIAGVIGLATAFSVSAQSPASIQETPASDTVTYIPHYASRILGDKEMASSLPSRAQEIIGRPAVMVLGDSNDVPFSQLFTPLVFDMQMLNETGLDTKGLRTVYQQDPYKLDSYSLDAYSQELMAQEVFEKGKMPSLKNEVKIVREVRSNALQNNIGIVKLTSAMLPQDRLASQFVSATGYQGELAIVNNAPLVQQTEDLEKKVIERVYWTTKFESNIQFSQNQMSDNWYKGGNNSLNLNMRNYFNLSYAKDNVKWVNELESKLGFFNSPNEPIGKFKISEDLFRIVSNFGLKAFNERWYYTLDTQLRTQLLRNRNKDSVLVTQPFAPFIIDGGPGMKYELEKKFNDPFKKLKFTANFSPVAVTFIYTYTNDVDKARIGLLPDEKHKLRLGSTVRMALDFDLSQSVTWQSRVFYNTSFQHVETEFENTLNFSINKYFSTRINLHLRFDDSVITDDKSFKKLLQYNELISFGFTYKI
ncbi:DUF3078 domain-containing protein [Porphyromonas cangingivalis]|uniref:DUF3078 domain-containing protein n=1 Tax=Porphyromonas cangingivalis TaxID=36874 RepID=A0A1T4LJL0_PORCN|nr:DUF3078 domain-containing protein [Porphyromonas cangingivalis]SJZ54929.1 Protein of unknown function [Porphyromonas cangingivalis]VEJ03001.1 Protein of uncharacterised function (DUF3078) [Porphyromonas cangingivalis]